MNGSRAIACAGDVPISFWLLDLSNAPSPDQCEWLSVRERYRASLFRNDDDRLRYRAAHCALRILIGNFTGIDAARVTFALGKHGKPFLPDVSDVHFSMSYAGDTALVGLSGRSEIGVDIERLRMIDDVAELAALHFDKAERARLAMIPSGRVRQTAFLQGWTRKEACIKACGLGLSLAPASFTSGVGGAPATVSLPVPGGVRFVEVATMTVDHRMVAAWSRVI